MVIREALETTSEAEREVQKTITAIKVLNYQSEQSLGGGKFIKAYKRELDIETELKWLSDYLNRQKRVVISEMLDAKENLNKECLRVKCKQIESMFQNIEDDENEDFGEE